MDEPLANVLIIDLSRHLPGPYASRMLANLGARVIKVEEPEMGDPLRMAPPFRAGRSLLAESLLGGVESIALDLKKEGGREVLTSLLEPADVMLETFRPGTLARLGLDPETLLATHRRLVLCSISGWGQEGPSAARAGHDLTYQAAAGSLAASGRTPHLPSADFLGAWSAIASITTALYARETSGRGTWIDTALFDSAMVGNVTNAVEQEKAGAAAGTELPMAGQLTGALPCYRLYRSSDGGLIALAALEPHFWTSFCEAAGCRELRGRQYDRDSATHREVAELIAGKNADDWQRLFTERDIPGEVVATPSEARSSEQARARGLDRDVSAGVPYPALVGGPVVGSWRPCAEGGLPRVGEHTSRVLAEFAPDWLQRSRRNRLQAGVGSRLSLRRSLQGWIGGLRS